VRHTAYAHGPGGVDEARSGTASPELRGSGDLS